MNFRKLGIIFSSAVFLGLPFQVFAEGLTVTPQSRLDGAEGKMENRQEKLQERKDKTEERQAEIKAKRTEKQKQIIDRMKEKLAAVVDRMNKMAGKLREHTGKLRNRAAEVAKNRGADTSKVETALQEAERHIGLAETEIAAVKQKLSELDSSNKPKDVAQTFRTGVQSVQSHFQDARKNLVAAVKALSSLSFQRKLESIKIDSGSSGSTVMSSPPNGPE